MTFEDELEAARRNAERRGLAEGERRKAMEIAVGLVRDGIVGLGAAATRVGVDPADLERELARAAEV